ncbi:MAG: hypothetical protein ACI4KM_00550 [Oscillospiraceae bacterium]
MNQYGFYIKMKSATQAEKARVFLMRNGIRSSAERVAGKGGCSFRLRVFSDRKGEVCSLLSDIGISCDLP